MGKKLALKSDSFGNLSEVLIISKIEEMGHFWTQNQLFWRLLSISPLYLSAIILDDKDKWVAKSGYFRFLTKNRIILEIG